MDKFNDEYKKSTDAQLQSLHTILGKRSSFKDPTLVSCYEPRIGIICFREGKVIGQSQICLS